MIPERLVVPPSVANTVKRYESTLSLSSSVVVVMNPDEPSIAKGRPDCKIEYTMTLLTSVEEMTKLIINFFCYNYTIEISFCVARYIIIYPVVKVTSV